MPLTITFAKNCALSSIAVIASNMTPAMSTAEIVRMHAADGTMNLVGELVEFKDDTYLLSTTLGPLHLNAARVSCEGAACPSFRTDTADVTLSGSETIAKGAIPLLLSGYAEHLNAEMTAKITSVDGEVIATIAKAEPNITASYLVAPKTSGFGFQQLMNGAVDIALSTQRMVPPESLSSHNENDNLVTSDEYVIGVDNLVLITHPDNPVTTLALWQLRDIYAGKLSNWSELGGPDLPITVISRPETSDARALFEDRLFSNQDDPIVTDTVIATDNNAVAAEVNTNPSAIGYVSHAFTRGAKTLALINECGFKTRSDIFYTKSEEYVFQRRLYMYAHAEARSETANDFLSYVTSTHAQNALLKAGFADLGIQSEIQTLDSIRGRLLRTPSKNPFEGVAKRDMLSQMANYERLSTTFRFDPSGGLDERAKQDMTQLKDYLERQAYGTRVMFVGFTDSVGKFESNRAESIANARHVMKNFVEFAEHSNSGALDLTYTGFGEIAPTACNTTEHGRAVNRRVEVWVSRATS